MWASVKLDSIDFTARRERPSLKKAYSSMELEKGLNCGSGKHQVTRDLHSEGMEVDESKNSSTFSGVCRNEFQRNILSKAGRLVKFKVLDTVTGNITTQNYSISHNFQARLEFDLHIHCCNHYFSPTNNNPTNINPTRYVTRQKEVMYTLH